MRKYTQRVIALENSHCGLLWNSIYYNTFVVSTLDFAAQLDPVHEEVLESERAALRKLAPGPGNWSAANALENLSQFGIGTGFRTIELTFYAAKLRVIRDLGLAHVSSKAESIRTVQADYLRRPFGMWHNRSFATVLRDSFSHFQKQGIIPQSIRRWTGNFQKLAREAIAQQICPYDLEENIRKNSSRWKFKDPPRHVAARLVGNFQLFHGKLSPAVVATYLRTLWNGIPTSRRMRTCKEFKVVGCVFVYSFHAQDSLEHYCRCPKLQAAFLAISVKPTGC